MRKRRSALVMPRPKGIFTSEPSNPNASFRSHMSDGTFPHRAVLDALGLCGRHMMSRDVTPCSCACSERAATIASISACDICAVRGSFMISARTVARKSSCVCARTMKGTPKRNAIISAPPAISRRESSITLQYTKGAIPTAANGGQLPKKNHCS